MGEGGEEQLTIAGRGRLLLGTAGWSYPDWRELVYPRSQRRPLEFLANLVDCVEINTTFYGPCSARSAQRWLQQVRRRPEFVFTAKAFRGFTHAREDEYPQADLRRAFVEGLRPLAEAGRLAAVLVQFPHHFDDRAENRRRIERITADLSVFELAVELRHRSWQRDEAMEFLRRLGLAVAALDWPVGRDGFNEPLPVTANWGYMRLHGRNAAAFFNPASGVNERYDYYYRPDEIEQIVERVAALAGRVRRLFVIANNHFRGKALATVLQLAHRLRGRKQPVPATLLKAYPALAAIAASRGEVEQTSQHLRDADRQGRLF